VASDGRVPAAGALIVADRDVQATDGSFAEVAASAVHLAARQLELDPEAFLQEIAQGEISLLIRYLAEAAPHLDDVELRGRIDGLLHRLTFWTGAED
jgi:hypothetical protein